MVSCKCGEFGKRKLKNNHCVLFGNSNSYDDALDDSFIVVVYFVPSMNIVFVLVTPIHFGKCSDESLISH